MQEDKKELVRKSISDLLNDDLPTTPQPSAITTPADNSALPAFNSIQPLNYKQVKQSANKKAQKIVDSLLKFYLSEEIIDKREYIKLRARTEQMTLASLFYQIKTSEHAITILLSEIDNGDVSPRMFEVLGMLQKSMLDTLKHQTLQMMASEENMKKMRRDLDVYHDGTEGDDVKKLAKDNSENLRRGSRNLMMEIQAELESGDKEEDETDYELK